jgi:hypothetical protein
MTSAFLGRHGAAPELTRRFRIAKSHTIPLDGVTCRQSGPISLIRRDSHPVAIPQRALRHSFYMVPSNSR